MTTDVRCLYCGSHRNPNGTCKGCGAEAPAAPCRSCGKPVPSPLDHCESCGAQCLAWKDAVAHELRCPRCSGRLERVDVGAVHVDGSAAGGTSHTAVEQCARCLGCFVRTEDFSELLHMQEAGQRIELRFVPPDGKNLPRQTLLALVHCPHCPREMDRARFDQRAELVVDVCPPHGMWLDAGELSMVLQYMGERSSGHITPSAAAREEKEQWDRVDQIRVNEAQIIAINTVRAEAATRQPGRGTVIAATAIAGPWAGLFVALRGMKQRR